MMGTTYRLYTGFITGYPESFGGQGSDSTVRVSCRFIQTTQPQHYRFKRLAIGNTSRSLVGSARLGYADEQELSSARVSRLLSAFGIPAADTTISTGDLASSRLVSLQQQTY